MERSIRKKVEEVEKFGAKEKGVHISRAKV
jgi:hypothetical protein